jgi:hypothetical protein
MSLRRGVLRSSEQAVAEPLLLRPSIRRSPRQEESHLQLEEERAGGRASISGGPFLVPDHTRAQDKKEGEKYFYRRRSGTECLWRREAGRRRKAQEERQRRDARGTRGFCGLDEEKEK